MLGMWLHNFENDMTGGLWVRGPQIAVRDGPSGGWVVGINRLICRKYFGCIGSDKSIPYTHILVYRYLSLG